MHKINNFFIQWSIINVFLTVFYVSGRQCTIGAKTVRVYTLVYINQKCVCVFESACFVLCVTPFFIYFFLLLVLLLVPSFVYVCHGVSGCSTASSSWLFQEMHLIVLGSEVSYLPLGHPPAPPPFFFFFLINFISCLQEAKLHCAQALLLCLIHAEK